MNEKPGNPYPLGATWDERGVNFSIFSEHATAVDLCLVDEAGTETRIPLKRRTGFVWHCYLADIEPGQRYAYRVHGPYEPERGLRFNPNVRLIDPYAKALSGLHDWKAGSFAYDASKDERGSWPSVKRTRRARHCRWSSTRDSTGAETRIRTCRSTS